MCKNIYYVSVNFNDRVDGNISGKVRSIYSSDDVEYICEKVYDKHTFKEDVVEELLKYSHQVSMNTSGIDGYSLKIIKKNDDYRMIVPEMESRYYWVSRYFENEDVEEVDYEEEESKICLLE